MLSLLVTDQSYYSFTFHSTNCPRVRWKWRPPGLSLLWQRFRRPVQELTCLAGLRKSAPSHVDGRHRKAVLPGCISHCAHTWGYEHLRHWLAYARPSCRGWLEGRFRRSAFVPCQGLSRGRRPCGGWLRLCLSREQPKLARPPSRRSGHCLRARPLRVARRSSRRCSSAAARGRGAYPCSRPTRTAASSRSFQSYTRCRAPGCPPTLGVRVHSRSPGGGSGAGGRATRAGRADA